MRWRRWDAAVVAGTITLDVVTVLTTVDSDDRPLMPLGWGLLIVSSAALLWRQRFPVAVLIFTAGTTLAYYPLGFPDAPIVLSTVIALYTVARDRGPMLSVIAAGLFSATLSATAEEPIQAAIGVVPILLLPAVLGEVARSRTRQTAQAEERATLAEVNLESEALRRVAEERLRIARELHDVLAHQVSLINVQAGAALHTREPDSAFDALRAIRTASGAALHEIRSVLGVLRDPMQPDLAALPELFSRTEATGLTVRARVDLPPPAPPPAVQLAAYRIVQEALTNVMRHSSATDADVSLHRTASEVEVIVENGGDTVAGIKDGNGIRGMAERAAAVGGDFQAGPRPGGGFRVHAQLPVAPAGNGTR